MRETYRWHQTYLEAICETDAAQLPARILEARAAIEQRLLSPVDPEEFTAIATAQKALELLWRQHEERNGPHY